MLFIDFKTSRKRAFAQGFLKGLGAPFLLFGSFEAPELPDVNPITLPKRSDGKALSGDWIKVGGDIRYAVKKYGKEATAAK